jgi:hypothetical protein
MTLLTREDYWMSITWRHSNWHDIEQGLAMQIKNRGDAIVGPAAAVEAWKYISRTLFFRR